MEAGRDVETFEEEEEEGKRACVCARARVKEDRKRCGLWLA